MCMKVWEKLWFSLSLKSLPSEKTLCESMFQTKEQQLGKRIVFLYLQLPYWHFSILTLLSLYFKGFILFIWKENWHRDRMRQKEEECSHLLVNTKAGSGPGWHQEFGSYKRVVGPKYCGQLLLYTSKELNQKQCSWDLNQYSGVSCWHCRQVAK